MSRREGWIEGDKGIFARLIRHEGRAVSNKKSLKLLKQLEDTLERAAYLAVDVNKAAQQEGYDEKKLKEIDKQLEQVYNNIRRCFKITAKVDGLLRY